MLRIMTSPLRSGFVARPTNASRHCSTALAGAFGAPPGIDPCSGAGRSSRPGTSPNASGVEHNGHLRSDIDEPKRFE